MPRSLSRHFNERSENNVKLPVKRRNEENLSHQPNPPVEAPGLFDLKNIDANKTETMKVQVQSVVLDEAEKEEEVDPSEMDLSVDNKWLPVTCGLHLLYDRKSGVPLSRNEIDKNMRFIAENPKELDSSQFLLLPSEYHNNDDRIVGLAAGMAFVCEYHNLLFRNRNDEVEGVKVVQKADISLDNAKENDTPIELPSGHTFKFSDGLCIKEMSDWKITDFKTFGRLAIRHVMSKVAALDPFFCTYSYSKVPTQGYIYIGDSFFDTSTKYLINAYGLTESGDLTTATISMSREVLRSLLDRKRSKIDPERIKAMSEYAKMFIRQSGNNIPKIPLDLRNWDPSASTTPTSSEAFEFTGNNSEQTI